MWTWLDHQNSIISLTGWKTGGHYQPQFQEGLNGVVAFTVNG